MPHRPKPIVTTPAGKLDPEFLAKAIGPLPRAFLAFLRRLDQPRPSGSARRRPPNK
jgi:hypothetical protein